MAEITRWEPFGELMSLRDAMDRLFEESMVRPRGMLAPLASGVAVDMIETDEAIEVQAEIPGVKPEDINITVTGDVLSIRGEAKQETEEEKGNYLRRERRYGSFCRQFTLATPVKVDEATADFQDGILHLTLPKAEEVKPKAIEVTKK
jgi:HSP20 family protein